MKIFAFLAAFIGFVLSATLSPAFADEPRFAGRGWNGGVHSVAYTVNGDLRHVTAAELALAGVSIFDQGAVFRHLQLVDQNFGGCGLGDKDPDAAGCIANDGIAGSATGPDKSRDLY